jgi:hypothetical protein
MENLPTIKRGTDAKIVQDLLNRFKHIIKQIINIVIVVGGVDTVDETESPVHAG